MRKGVNIEQAMAGRMPYASVGSGPPLVALPGVAPVTASRAARS